MAARESIQNNPHKAVEAFHHDLPLTSEAIPDPSIRSQMGHSGGILSVNTIGEADSRDEAPKNWDEVFLLGDALKPSIRSFSRVTSRTPPAISGSAWLSYNGQLEILQQESDRCWGVDGRAGPPPKLAKLAEWEGGIHKISNAELHITEEMTEKFLNNKIRGYSYSEGSLGWHQQTFGEQAYKEAHKILLAADARQEKLKAQAINGEEQQNICETLTEAFDMIVAQDPERYLAWLATMGFVYFNKNDHNPCKLGWDEWLRWEAPMSFQRIIKPDHNVARPPTGPGAINKSKYGPPGVRPTITLEEAKKGNKRFMELRDVAGGMPFSSKEEEAPYYMMNGQAMSRAAAAHYHVIRGKDCWLFKLEDSLNEEPKDPSRRREAEVEASFLGSQGNKL